MPGCENNISFVIPGHISTRLPKRHSLVAHGQNRISFMRRGGFLTHIAKETKVIQLSGTVTTP